VQNLIIQKVLANSAPYIPILKLNLEKFSEGGGIEGPCDEGVQ